MAFTAPLRPHSRSSRAEIVIVGVGLAAVWIGAHLGALLATLTIRGHQTDDLSRHWLTAAALVAGGAVAGSSGTGSPGLWFRHLTGRALHSRLAVWPCVPIVIIWSRALASAAEASMIKVVMAMFAFQMALIALVEWRRSRADRRSFAPARPHTRAGVGIAVIAALSVTMSIGAFADTYPLSRYAMYSNPQQDVGVTSIVRYVGTTTSGELVRLPPPIARQTALRMVRRNEVDALKLIALEAARTHGGLASVTVIVERVHIAPHPEPVSAVVTSSNRFLEVQIPAAQQ